MIKIIYQNYCDYCNKLLIETKETMYKDSCMPLPRNEHICDECQAVIDLAIYNHMITKKHD